MHWGHTIVGAFTPRAVYLWSSRKDNTRCAQLQRMSAGSRELSITAATVSALQPNYSWWSSNQTVSTSLSDIRGSFSVHLIWGWWSVAIMAHLPPSTTASEEGLLVLDKLALRTRCRSHSDNLLTRALQNLQIKRTAYSCFLSSKSIADCSLFIFYFCISACSYQDHTAMVWYGHE